MQPIGSRVLEKGTKMRVNVSVKMCTGHDGTNQEEKFGLLLSTCYNQSNEQTFYIETSLGSDKQKIKLGLDTNRPISLFFSPKCVQDKCVTENVEYQYDNTKTGGKDLDKPYQDETYNNIAKWSGKQFLDTIKFGPQYYKDLTIAVVDSSSSAEKVDWNGYLGLRTGGELIIKVMKEAQYPQITIQEGRGFIPKKNKQVAKFSYGSFTFGSRDAKGCGNFTFFNTTNHNNQWALKAIVKIGNTKYDFHNVALNIGRRTQIPQNAFDEFKLMEDKTSLSDIPDIRFVDDKEYVLKAEDFAWYNKDVNQQLEDYSEPTPTELYRFALGSEFLQNYCVALSSDANVANKQIGFAENFNNKSSDIKSATLTSLILVVFSCFTL
ncbi:unnamed protein product [Bursaphelenchus okinawaensis]|uniref:Peptidase A1 domain-containing protein n=1 Tax=Bursaphelenchus okinawaensis TaxID=465554 RepID=A0A811KXF1_9BILA|nr:unnamed protein product [Bursaphelenchus okinawaensis]CAG9113389.1 unnamed protein product [Bursaphelenchus okinawaensis]